MTPREYWVRWTVAGVLFLIAEWFVIYSATLAALKSVK